MSALTESLWADYAAARVAAWKMPSAINETKAREALSKFIRAFLKADEGEAA